MRNDTAPILIAVGDAMLHPEATQLAAATGRPLIDAAGPDDVSRHFARAFAVLIDDERLPDIESLPARGGVFGLSYAGADGEGPPGNTPQVTRRFALPAQAADLLKALGQLALGGDGPATAAVSPVQPEARPGLAPKNEWGAGASAGTVLCFVGAVGGAGTSTLAAAVARTASPQLEPVVVDANRTSGGLDLLLGIEDEPGARWGDIDIGEGHVDRAQVRRALPVTGDGVAVLSASRSVVPGPAHPGLDRVTTVLGSGGLTIVDAAAGEQPNRCDHTFIVTPAEVRAAASAALVAAECRAANSPASVVLRHRGWSGMTAAEVEHVTKTEVVAEIKHLPRLVKATELAGLPTSLPRPLVAAAKALLEVAS